MKSQIVCPLGYNYLLCNLPLNVSCHNFPFCRLQVLAWELPYEYVDNVLVVKSYGHAFGLTTPTGRYFDKLFDLGNVIDSAWAVAGWFPAEPWPFDPIPF
jgi:hypothetical protein